MNWADITVLVVVGISALVSFIRGAVKEVVSLATWILALWSARRFYEALDPYLADMISTPSARSVAAMVAIFVIVLLLGGMTNMLLGKLVTSTGLKGTDRSVGMLFGGLRGVAVLVFLIALAGYTKMPEDPWWNESIFIPHLVQASEWVASLMPQEVIDRSPLAIGESLQNPPLPPE